MKECAGRGGSISVLTEKAYLPGFMISSSSLKETYEFLCFRFNGFETSFVSVNAMFLLLCAVLNSVKFWK